MTSIPATTSSTFTLPATTSAPTVMPTPAPADAAPSMGRAMDTAFAVGQPTDASGAATILGTGQGYLQGASSMLVKLDEGIASRTKELDALRLSDPQAAIDKAEQLDMLQRLRDRIQLSIERVGDILAGKHRDDVGGPEGADGAPQDPADQAAAADERHRQRDQDALLLEQRRQLLAPQGFETGRGAATASVAGAYAAVTSRA